VIDAACRFSLHDRNRFRPPIIRPAKAPVTKRLPNKHARRHPGSGICTKFRSRTHKRRSGICIKFRSRTRKGVAEFAQNSDPGLIKDVAEFGRLEAYPTDAATAKHGFISSLTEPVRPSPQWCHFNQNANPGPETEGANRPNLLTLMKLRSTATPGYPRAMLNQAVIDASDRPFRHGHVSRQNRIGIATPGHTCLARSTGVQYAGYPGPGGFSSRGDAA